MRTPTILTLALALLASLVLAVPSAAQSAEVVRIAPGDPVQVAVDFSRTSVPEDGVDRVLLGRHDVFADALAAGTLADGAPLLLTDPGFLSDPVVAELARLDPSTVTILGGTAAVSDGVADHLDALGHAVERLAGGSRIETAIAIAETVEAPSAILSRAFPTDAADADPTQAFADSLAAGAWAASSGQPVLLSQSDALSPATREHILAAGYDEITIVGGTAAVSQAVEDELAGLVPTVTRVSGPTRFDTAVAVNAARGLDRPTSGDALLITDGQGATAWAEGFAAASLSAATSAPLVLASQTTLPPASAAFLSTAELTGSDVRLVCSAHPTACAQAEGLLGLQPQIVDPLEVTVDDAVVPARTTLSGLDGEEHPVGAASDGIGGQADFTLDELVIAGDDEDLQVALDVTAGTLRETLPLADLMPGSQDAIHIIDLDPAVATVAALPQSVGVIEPYASGSLAFSDQAALDLTAVAADLASRGITAGPNILTTSDGLVDRQITEAATADFGGYDANPFTWPHLDGDLDFGVPDAWRALELADRIPTGDDRLDFGVIDAGFPEDPEIPAGSSGFNPTPNDPGACGGNCPFHGFDVTVTAVGVVDNARGTAGVAGPVADARMVSDAGGTLDLIASVLRGVGRLVGSDVINISQSSRVPLGLGWAARPLGLVTGALAASGVGLFSSAGNVNGGNADTADVDRERCAFGICVEAQLVIPCELAGVTCVGGTAPDSTDRDPGSWFGDEDVDLWAPFTVFIGPIVTSGPTITDGVTQKSGTSFSTPYVAGAYLLVKAADPDASRGRILTTLHRTALLGTARAGSIVQPYDAVIRRFGGNDPFDVAWNSPDDGMVITREQSVLRLVAEVSDPDGRDPDVQWFVNGELIGVTPDVGISTLFDLRDGRNEMRLVISDGPYRYTETRTIEVVNTPPSLTIDDPMDGQSFVVGQDIELRVRSSDPDELDGAFSLDDDDITWLAAGTVIGDGHRDRLSAEALGVGAHTITVRGDDGTDVTTETVDIIVGPAPDDRPPSAQIAAPDDRSGFLVTDVDATGAYVEIELVGFAQDPEDGSLSGDSLVWTTTADENGDGSVATRTVGTGGTVIARLYESPETGSTTHTIRLTATDSAGNTATASRTVFVDRIE